jgi:hypothetical protein
MDPALNATLDAATVEPLMLAAMPALMDMFSLKANAQSDAKTVSTSLTENAPSAPITQASAAMQAPPLNAHQATSSATSNASRTALLANTVALQIRPAKLAIRPALLVLLQEPTHAHSVQPHTS